MFASREFEYNEKTPATTAAKIANQIKSSINVKDLMFCELTPIFIYIFIGYNAYITYSIDYKDFFVFTI